MKVGIALALKGLMWPQTVPDSSSAYDPFVLRHDDYVLKFRPQPTADARFLAYVVIYRDIGGRGDAGGRPVALRTVQALMPDIPSHATHHDAASAGREAGLRWIAGRTSASLPLPASTHCPLAASTEQGL